ncbi:MAG: permease-like cell division protein FtsX [Clostridia bacterium]|nr:permease-like cell division protein FtsX [Clostridia bacterium]
MFRAIKRSITEGVRGMLKNGLMTITSVFVVTACIFIFGVFLMITANINHMTETMANKYQMDVFVEKPSDGDLTVYEERKAYVKSEIEKIENIDKDAITHVDGVEKFRKFKESLDENELKSFEGLPDDVIADAYAVKMIDLEKADETYKALSEIDGVESVENSNEFVEAINGIKGTVKTFSVWIIVVFAIISLFIISNTIKLTVHNRRKEINIMKYVGATDSYIRGPFIMEGILVGLVSALVAFLISRWGYLGLMTTLSGDSFMSASDFLSFNEIWATLLGAYAILGTIIGAFGSSISVRRYLKV